MNSVFRIKETLYIETSRNSVFPLIPSGRRVPTSWEQPFTTNRENQGLFDLHLLRGNSDDLTENITVGKWRIAGIPPGVKGEHLIHVNIRVGIDGCVRLVATLANHTLPVTFLVEGIPEIPLTSAVPTIPLEKLIKRPCPECLCAFVIRTENWKKEPFALCLDCGHEFELPESQILNNAAPWEDLPPELLKTLGIELPHNPGGLPSEEIQELQEKGFRLNTDEEPDLTIDSNKILQQIPGMIFGQKKDITELDYNEIVRLAGDPLPEDERRNCPKCEAVISRDAKRCEWCGQNL